MTHTVIPQLRSQQGAIFDRLTTSVPGHVGIDYLALERHPLFHEIASGIPGWDEILTARDHLDAVALPEYQSSRAHDDAEPDLVLAGADPFDIVRDREARRAADDILDKANNLLSQARITLSGNAQGWVGQHTDDIAAALTRKLNEIRVNAGELVRGPLRSVVTGLDLERNPEASSAFVEFGALAEQFTEAMTAVYALAHFDRRMFWPALNIVSAMTYPKAWPQFYLHFEPLVMQSGMYAGSVIPKEPAPWGEDVDRDLLRYMAGNDLPFTVATRGQLDERQASLTRLAAQRREQRHARELES